MPAKPEVPTWQIFSTTGGHFRWSLTGGAPDPPSLESAKTLTSRLPSMADLLRQAPLKLLEPDGCDPTGGAPMFKTGSGKSVSVQKSSILKARSVLEGDETMNREGGDRNDDWFPMFRTGSGKSVTTRQSSIRKAAAVLKEGAEKGGSETVIGDGGNNDDFPMFRTGSGQSVTVRQSSIRKAAAVLDADISNKGVFKPPQCSSNNYDIPMFQTGSGKSVLVKQSSINRAVSVLQGGDSMETDETCKLIDDRQYTFSNSLFQTGSGKSVNISSAGISRATTLLGLERNNSMYSSKYFENAINQSDKDATDKWDRTKCGMNYRTGSKYNINPKGVQSDRSNSFHFSSNLYSLGSQPYNGEVQNHMGSEVHTSDFGHPPLKFQTAGGKSLSISSDALNRARSLLGGAEVGSLQNIVNTGQSTVLVKDGKTDDETPWNKENVISDDISKHQSELLPPNPSSTNCLNLSSPLSGKFSKGVHTDQVKANGFHASMCMSHLQESHKKGLYAAHAAFGNHGKIAGYRNSVTPLADISNNIHTGHASMNGLSGEKKRPQRSSISPFKRPRVSRFTTPLNHNFSSPPTDSTKLSISENCRPRIRVSTRYPFKFKKKALKDFFGSPPAKHNLFRQLPDEVQYMSPDNAKVYRFSDASGSERIGSVNFWNMLLHSGASLSSMTNEWVANHYKLIVWKLACFERCYPAKACGKFLTVFNVLEELRYRYEREINYGHRSTIMKILDGDASPASMMVLCISSIYPSSSPDINKLNDATNVIDENQNRRSFDGAESNHATKIQLTDGWYCLDAILDASLSKQLAAGKLFVGQKLRIWGAGLCGWVGPLSPLEASKTVVLLIHINGTYRAHWSYPLGFCKNLGAPLAFRCIKGAGGKVPRTLVGITRIYPVLYKERFPNGGSIVRSERMEEKALQLYNQRRSNIVENIMSEQHDLSINANDSEEGARIFRILERSAEPEVLMADMTSEQLMSFSTYQSKQEATRQSSMQKKIEKALEDAGLSSRAVTPFIRLRVVGLTSKGSYRRNPPKEGVITIWNPTEKQKHDLVEGQIYTVTGLMPLNFGSDILYLQARGSSTMWKPVPSIIENFEPFFTPRKPVLLSNLGEVSLASEFDIAAVVVHVGEVYISGCQKKQWIFVTDGSRCSSELAFEDVYDCLLAISFSSPAKDDDSFGLLSQSLAGTTIALYNLVKRARDPLNHLWVAEATENSTYSVCDNLPKDFHFKEAADSARQWSEVSSLTIQKLRERVLCIVDGQGS